MDAKPASIVGLASCSFHATGCMNLDMTCQCKYAFGPVVAQETFVEQSPLHIRSNSVPHFA
jgi:hypothetical protein